MSLIIGTNIRRDASDSVDLIVASGARFVRFVPMLEHDLSGYLRTLHTRGVEILAVLAKESFGLYSAVDPDQAMEQYRQRYGTLVHSWQVGNEWDTESDSSWTMTMDQLVTLGRKARRILGDGAYLIVGGAADGSPSDEPEERLSGADLSWANAIAIHTYGQGVPGWTDDDGITHLPFSPYGFSSTVRDLIDGYHAEAPTKDLWITEMGFRWDELGEARASQYAEAYLSYLLERCPEVKGFAQFCLTDAQVPGFGLYYSAGHEHMTADVFKHYADEAAAREDDDPVEPEKPMTAIEAEEMAWQDLFLAATGQRISTLVYGPDLGIVKYWREHAFELGSAVGPERQADDGTVYQSFSCGIVRWNPTTGASKVA